MRVSCIQEAARRHHERPLGRDRPSERQHVELRLPAHHQLQMPSSLTPAKKRAWLRKVAGTTLLIEPLRPITPGAVRARAWYGNTYGGVAPESADYFFGDWRSRTKELIADNLLHPTMATTTRPCPTDDQRPTPPASATTRCSPSYRSCARWTRCRTGLPRTRSSSRPNANGTL